MDSDLEGMELFAAVGEDELKPGEVGIKQGYCPAGFIPMVSVSRAKMEKYWPQFEEQAREFGKKISLARFVIAEVVKETG